MNRNRMKFPKILNRTDHRQRKMRHLSVIKMNQLNQFGRFSKKISAQNLLIHDIPSAFFPSSISIMIRLKRAEVANTLPLNLQDNKRACEEKKKTKRPNTEWQHSARKMLHFCAGPNGFFISAFPPPARPKG